MLDYVKEIAPILIAITSLIAALTSMASVVLGYLNAKKIEVVHKATNSLTDKLVEAEKANSLAQGLKEGREDLRPPVNRPAEKAG